MKSEGTMEFYSPLFDQSDGSNLHSYVLNKVMPPIPKFHSIIPTSVSGGYRDPHLKLSVGDWEAAVATRQKWVGLDGCGRGQLDDEVLKR